MMKMMKKCLWCYYFGLRSCYCCCCCLYGDDDVYYGEQRDDYDDENENENENENEIGDKSKREVNRFDYYLVAFVGADLQFLILVQQ